MILGGQWQFNDRARASCDCENKALSVDTSDKRIYKETCFTYAFKTSPTVCRNNFIFSNKRCWVPTNSVKQLATVHGLYITESVADQLQSLVLAV